MRRTAYKYRKRKPRRGSATTIESKARSMQTTFRKYTGTTLTISSAKQIINNPPKCPYCSEAIPWNELSLDHIQPRSRDGEDSPDNLVWCCGRCNRTKGNLTADEYKALLVFLAGWPVMRESVLLRLRAGGAALRKRRRY